MANNQRIILWVVIGFLVWQSGMLTNILGAGGGTTTPPPAPTTPPAPTGIIKIDGGCGVDSTTITVSAQDYYTLGAVGGVHRYRIDGNPAKAISDGGTFTSSKDEQINILFANQTTPASFSYYSDVMDYTVLCEGTKTLSKKLYANDTFTVNIFNEEGNLISDPENETLGAGDTITLSGNIKGQYKKAAAPYGGVIIAEYNSSTMDNVEVSFDGITKKTTTPTFYTVGYTTHVTKSYEFPALITNNEIKMGTYLDADDTKNPSSEAGQDIKLTYCTINYYVDEDDQGNYKKGIEDENGLQVGNCYPYTLSVD